MVSYLFIPSLPPAFAGFYQIKKIKNIIEKDYDKFKDAWKNHKED